MRTANARARPITSNGSAMDELYIRQSEITGRIHVAGYGPRPAMWIGRTDHADLRIGDYVGLLAIGGLAHFVVRLGDIRRDTDETVLVFDWNGARDSRPGGSLLPDEVTVPTDGSCKEVWRPVTEPGSEGTS